MKSGEPRGPKEKGEKLQREGGVKIRGERNLQNCSDRESNRKPTVIRRFKGGKEKK